MNRSLFPALFVCVWLAVYSVRGDEPSAIMIEDSLVHLRATHEREWAWFPETSKANSLTRRFTSDSNDRPWTLTLRQQDVKQTWEVLLNDQSLGRLTRDENDMQVDFNVPARSVRSGENLIDIRQKGDAADDIRVGQIQLHPVATDQRRNQASVRIKLVDQSGNPTPGRITVLDRQGTLMPVDVDTNDALAVRNGVVYTLTGEAEFGLAAGEYRIVAGRGFEYSIAETDFDVDPGQKYDQTMTIVRQVDTSGWAACDPHVHTVTHSGHGDCTIQERMVTLAGEGIELPIATDHNKAIDYTSTATSLGAAKYFTPVIGDECTTRTGHFNIFPLRSGGKLPDHTQEDWGPLLRDIFSTPDVRVAILNHARDIHSGYRPFSPVHHLALTGENLDGRPMRFNAMEICNSGAVQTDAMQLFGDWCGLINRGLAISPIGSSDSHDVARFIVGQGRTYIRCDDSVPGRINADEAIEALIAGKVIVSYGLMVQLKINDVAQAGDLASVGDSHQDLIVTAEVHGPAWTDAESVALFVCGRERIRHHIKPDSASRSSLKTTVTWRIPRSEFSHDVWLSAVAMGPGVMESYWKTALPYQPTSKSFSPYVFSATGAIRVDCDGDGRFTSPLGYAKALFDEHSGNPPALLNRLKGMDPSVIHQTASLLRATGVDLDQLATGADEQVASSIAEYARAHRRSIVAELEGIQ